MLSFIWVITLLHSATIGEGMKCHEQCPENSIWEGTCMKVEWDSGICLVSRMGWDIGPNNTLSKWKFPHILIPQSNLPTFFLFSMIYIDKPNSFISSYPLRHNFQSLLVTFKIKQQIWLCKLKYNTSHIKTILWNEKWLSKLNSYTNYKITPRCHISKLAMGSKSYSEYRKIEP